MNRCSFCEWIPILPWPVWPLAGHARLGQNTVVGSMTILLSWLCWGACQEEVCLDPRFLCNLTPPRFSVELPGVIRRHCTWFLGWDNSPQPGGTRPPPLLTPFTPQRFDHSSSSCQFKDQDIGR